MSIHPVQEAIASLFAATEDTDEIGTAFADQVRADVTARFITVGPGRRFILR